MSLSLLSLNYCILWLFWLQSGSNSSIVSSWFLIIKFFFIHIYSFVSNLERQSASWWLPRIFLMLTNQNVCFKKVKCQGYGDLTKGLTMVSGHYLVQNLYHTWMVNFKDTRMTKLEELETLNYFTRDPFTTLLKISFIEKVKTNTGFNFEEKSDLVYLWMFQEIILILMPGYSHNIQGWNCSLLCVTTHLALCSIISAA